MATLTRLLDKHVLFDPLRDALRKIGSELDMVIHCTSFKEGGRFMKKKSRIEIDSKIVSRIKREMEQPRLTESVRNGFSAQAARAAEKPSARSARA